MRDTSKCEWNAFYNRHARILIPWADFMPSLIVRDVNFSLIVLLILSQQTQTDDLGFLVNCVSDTSIMVHNMKRFSSGRFRWNAIENLLTIVSHFFWSLSLWLPHTRREVYIFFDRFLFLARKTLFFFRRRWKNFRKDLRNNFKMIPPANWK